MEDGSLVDRSWKILEDITMFEETALDLTMSL